MFVMYQRDTLLKKSFDIKNNIDTSSTYPKRMLGSMGRHFLKNIPQKIKLLKAEKPGFQVINGRYLFRPLENFQISRMERAIQHDREYRGQGHEHE